MTLTRHIRTLGLYTALVCWCTQANQPPVHARQGSLKAVVLKSLSATPGETWYQKVDLIDLGIDAFPVYDAMLADAATSDLHRMRILDVLCVLPGDRSRYIAPAHRALLSPERRVRQAAVTLLAHIGSSRDTSPVVAMLFDESDLVVVEAAKTLAAVGGPNDLIALDAYLRSAAARGLNADFLANVAKRRTSLRDRLAQPAVPLPKQ